jgi:hypothetical protein
MREGKCRPGRDENMLEIIIVDPLSLKDKLRG